MQHSWNGLPVVFAMNHRRHRQSVASFNNNENVNLLTAYVWYYMVWLDRQLFSLRFRCHCQFILGVCVWSVVKKDEHSERVQESLICFAK